MFNSNDEIITFALANKKDLLFPCGWESYKLKFSYYKDSLLLRE